MEKDKILIELSRDDALVLFEFIARNDDDSKSFKFVDNAEEQVIWKLQAELERSLVEILKPNYESLIKEARNRIKNQK